MLDYGDLRLGEQRAQRHVKFRFWLASEWADQTDALDVGARRAGEAQAFANGSLGSLFGCGAGAHAARDFRFLHGSDQLAVFQNGAGRVAKQPAQTENDHLLFFSIFAQASLSVTVRLNTGRSEVLSRSGVKYPSRSN